MDLGEIVIIAGVGCRRGASATAIMGVIEAALAHTRYGKGEVGVIATAATKRSEIGIAAAASALGVPLVFIAYGDLQSASARTVTRSARVAALVGVPSVAEAAALAAGGPTARLIAARIACGGATCALAETRAEP
jgi:cobalt-precorrin 5A hydrolase